MTVLVLHESILNLSSGIYAVTSTLEIPAGTQIVGEAWSIIAGKGTTFSNVGSPQVVVRVSLAVLLLLHFVNMLQAGASGSTGKLEISDIVFSTIGPSAGAIILEWNVKQSAQGNTGTWDTHIRIGGGALNLQGYTTLTVSEHTFFSS